jgi:mevalonate kinase
MAVENEEISAPAGLILLGEHSVVAPYYKMSIGMAVTIFARAHVEGYDSKKFAVHSLNVKNVDTTVTEDILRRLYDSWKNRGDRKDNSGILRYIEENKEVSGEALPFLTIAARLLVEQEINIVGKKVIINSEIPTGVGYGSSAASSTAFTIALIASGNKVIDDSVVIDIIRDGERVLHKNEGAGGIDVTVSYYGGYATWQRGVATKLDISTNLNIVVIETGPKRPTGEMVKVVKEFYERDPTRVSKIMDEIDECSHEGLTALRKGDVEEVGRQMFRDHELLRELGVSTDKLDLAVKTAKENGAYGAKLKGGGGGGIGLAICPEPEHLVAALSKLDNIIAKPARIAEDGARRFLKRDKNEI